MLKAVQETSFRIAASIPALRGLYAPELPPTRDPIPADRPLRLEIVSHCWRYAHLLEYQLSSLVLFRPRRLEVRMTVFHAPDHDEPTARVLELFREQNVEGVEWNPRSLDRKHLFRRAIGRNLAARRTDADWIWFADCDILFRERSLDILAGELRGRQDFLVYPCRHRVTELLPSHHPTLSFSGESPGIVDVDPGLFREEPRDRAVGAFQIVRSDVARAAGYCGTIPFYQKPVSSWQKTYEDRAFRWVLGTQGTPIDVPGIYRIRHAAKGRKGVIPGKVLDQVR